MIAEVLERTQWDFFWTPDDVTVVDRPELAFLSSSRPLAHINSAYRLRGSGDQLEMAISQVASVHLGPSRFQLADTVALAPIERALAKAGYSRGDEHVASVIEVGAYRPRPSDAFRVVRVTDIEALRDSISIIDEVFSSQQSSTSDAQLEAMLTLSTGANARVIRFVAYDTNDQPVSYGGLNVHSDLQFGLFWGGSTRQSARGQGAYSAIVASRIAFAQRLGLAHVGLYARNTTSAPIVAAQGFKDVGRMVHWNREMAGNRGHA